MKELTKSEAKVLNIILPYRIDNLVKSAMIENRLNASERSVQHYIERLRRKGHPIGCFKEENRKGYYMARSLEELEPGMNTNVAQAKTMLETAEIQRNIDFEEYWSNIKERGDDRAIHQNSRPASQSRRV